MTETPRQAARRLSARWIAQGYGPRALHEYRAANGGVIYWRIRLEHPDGDKAPEGRKILRPMKVNGVGVGYSFGEPSFPDGKPLYHLDRLAAHPTAPVWIVEGEKAADALTKMGAIATTSGGVDSAHRADWTPLRGRECRLWRDNDEAGTEYAGNVAAILVPLECHLSAIDVDRLGLPPRGDAWDWLQAHQDATLADLDALPTLTATAPSSKAPAADSCGPAWPDAMAPEAFHGIAGEFVRMVGPNTEADPAAILVQFLAAFGALVGRGPHYRVEGDEHHTNLFTLIVGATAKGRKGTSLSRVREVFQRIDGWKPDVSGLSSGEGVKYHVRDAKEESRAKKHGEVVKEITDEGVADKRLLVVEPEFASVLRAAQRQGSTLSATIRQAWDTGNLRTLTKHDPVTATGAHICIVGHITSDELRAELTATDSANGFANRFLFVAVRRSKLLPFGGDQADEDETQVIADRIEKLAKLARTRQRVVMTTDAREVWAKVYPVISAGGDGLHGAVTARAEAQVIRLTLVYCLLDGNDHIDVPYLLAALAVWQYCDATAKQIFGASLGDRTADEIMRQLHHAGDAGLTRTAIRDLFSRNLSADRIGAALELLRRKGKAACVPGNADGTSGRPPEIWKVVN